MVKSGISNGLPYVSTNVLFCFGGDPSSTSDVAEDMDVVEGDRRGLSAGDMLTDEAGVESWVATRRKADSTGRAEVVMIDGKQDLGE